jgi:carbon monoxide dehydrogenase subunit G
MRFVDVRQVPAPRDQVWAALHDTSVLRRVIPGCERLSPLGPGSYAATLSARVGRLADTYRGDFEIVDLHPGTALVVRVNARGRCGRLELDLQVRLGRGRTAATTALAYDATARVGGLVARLGTAPLTVAGGHLTGCFFRDLDRSVAAAPVDTRERLRTSA